MSSTGMVIEHRLKHLESHLEQENPILLNAVQSFRKLDNVAYRMGLLSKETSFATQIPWWPLISILGTFSAGKSSFINTFLGTKLQRSGNQAVDEKFTVVCFSKEQSSLALPGVALDSDPRFPFYQISGEIEKVARGEGSRIDAYLQLKTTPSEALRGKIVIDSPGFDADAQRTATLRITDHIIDLSDLVLVFFDARHPEPGAMRDTLDHLVSSTISRPDSSKFLYILNQLDTAAREDNPEEVVAAWQRALGERGLTAGRFFTIYDEDAAVPIKDPALRHRFASKRDSDLAEIYGRMQQVEFERAYRIVGALDKTALDIREQAVPTLTDNLTRWRKRVLIGDAVVFGIALAAFFGITIGQGLWNGLSLEAGWWQWVRSDLSHLFGFAVLLFIVAVAVHYGVRRLAARSLLGRVRRMAAELGIRGDLGAAFLKNTKPWRSIFSTTPAGWGRRSKRAITKVLEDTDQYVQALNDRFTNPSGAMEIAAAGEHPPEPASSPSTEEPSDSEPSISTETKEPPAAVRSASPD